MSYEIDFRSDTWRAIEQRATNRLAEFRQKNDGHLSFDDTLRLRGRIAELKELLTLAKPAPALTADE